jgi:shikimate kinase
VNPSEIQHVNLNEDRGCIFLIGFMGTGKTHWGRIWAARHHYTLIDLDEAIEQDEQTAVADIFEKRGEDYFRQKEAIMLRSMEPYLNVIISTGGGAPCFFDNINWMNAHGLTILLKASPAFILKNILAQEGKRPLVKNFNEAELLFYIEQKLKEREQYYNKASIFLDAESINESSLDSFIFPTE